MQTTGYRSMVGGPFLFCIFDRRFFSTEFFSHSARKYTMKTYKIVRFRFNGKAKTIRTGLTLEQAQEWCKDPKTHGKGWFDGYEEE